MKYALFLGCTIPARCRNYEISARRVAEKLDLELVTLDDFSCCGYPLKSADKEMAYLLSARNLAISEQHGIDIVTLCSSCTSMLQETIYKAQNDSSFLDRINGSLREIGREFNGKAKVKHFAKVLIEDIGLEEITKKVSFPLKGLRVANHYGCHYLKPGYIYPEPEDPDHPLSLGFIIEAVGAEQIHYMRERECCGGPAMVADEDTALLMAKQKLDSIATAKADK